MIPLGSQVPAFAHASLTIPWFCPWRCLWVLAMRAVVSTFAAEVGEVIVAMTQLQRGLVQRASDACKSVIMKACAQIPAITLVGPISMHSYGSRVSGYGGPWSDLDVVAEIPFKPCLELTAFDQRQRNLHFMQTVLISAAQVIVSEPGCGRVQAGAVTGKQTLVFEFEGCLPVDLSVEQRWLPEWHWQSRSTTYISNALAGVPVVAQNLCRTVVMILKRQGVAWVDRQGVPLGTKSKGIHWVHMFIAWWRVYNPRHTDSYRLLYEFFTFVAFFPWKHSYVDLKSPTVIRARTAYEEKEPMYLADPNWTDSNLFCRVDVHEARRIEQILRATRSNLFSIMISCWQEVVTMWREMKRSRLWMDAQAEGIRIPQVLRPDEDMFRALDLFYQGVCDTSTAGSVVRMPRIIYHPSPLQARG